MAGHMSFPAHAKPRAGSAEIAKQRGAVVDALDRLFTHEVPIAGRRRIELRLVWPRESVLDRNPTGEGLLRGCAPSSLAAAGIYGFAAAMQNCSRLLGPLWPRARSDGCGIGHNLRRCGVKSASTGWGDDEPRPIPSLRKPQQMTRRRASLGWRFRGRSVSCRRKEAAAVLELPKRLCAAGPRCVRALRTAGFYGLDAITF